MRHVKNLCAQAAVQCSIATRKGKTTDRKDTSTCTTMDEDSTACDSQSSDLEFFNNLSHDGLEGKCQVAELAEAFGLTQLQDYQRNAINAALNGKDTLIIQQTGSGKSLCYQFPPVYTHTKAIVICPTISLMQDQHAILTARGIQCTYLGSVQVDKTLECQFSKSGSSLHTLCHPRVAF